MERREQVVLWCRFIIMSRLVVGAAGLGTAATAAAASAGGAVALALKAAVRF